MNRSETLDIWAWQTRPKNIVSINESGSIANMAPVQNLTRSDGIIDHQFFLAVASRKSHTNTFRQKIEGSDESRNGLCYFERQDARAYVQDCRIFHSLP